MRRLSVPVLATLIAVGSAMPMVAPAGAAPPSGRAADRVPEPTGLSWQRVSVDSDEQFRGLDVVDRQTAWVGGSAGSVFRTTDGGQTWDDVSPRGAEGLLFRDVEAQNANHASVMAIGEGEDSRIYTTTDGGQSWSRAFTNHDPAAFYDCMAFWRTGRHGIAMSDPVNGKFRIISTHDGGRSWARVPSRGMPEAVDGEFGFAASGTCLVAEGKRRAWLASGGSAARIYSTRDQGRHWRVTRSTIPATPAGGVFSLAFDGPHRGLAVGGDFERPDNGVDASGRTVDGRHWTAGGDLSGYRSGVAWLANTHRRIAVAVGPTGSDVTYDGGRTWARFSRANFDAVSCADDGSCWASGPEGAVARLLR